MRAAFPLLLLAVALSAGAASATTVSIQLEQKAGGVAGSTLNHAAGMAYDLASENLTIEVRFKAPLKKDCTKVGVALVTSTNAQTPLTSTTGTGDACSFTLPATSLPVGVSRVVIKYDNQEALSVDVNGPNDVSGDTALPPLQELLNCKCRAPAPGAYYNEGKNEAAFYVTPLGKVIRRPAQVIDQNDQVHVYVCVDSRLQPYLKVQRTSEFGAPGTVALAGEGLAIPGVGTRKALGGPALPPRVCLWDETVLSDFAPGHATVAISEQMGDTEVPLGTFDFGVNQNYVGTITFGPAFVRSPAGSFLLVDQGGTQVIARDSEGKWDAKYALFLTPFLFSGPRDLQKTPSNPLDYVNPTIGVVPDDVTKHFMVGLAGNMNLVQLTVGADWLKEKALSKSSGLHTGDAFAGTADALPIVEKRSWHFFISAAVDLRLATSFFSTLTTGGK